MFSMILAFMLSAGPFFSEDYPNWFIDPFFAFAWAFSKLPSFFDECSSSYSAPRCLKCEIVFYLNLDPVVFYMPSSL